MKFEKFKTNQYKMEANRVIDNIPFKTVRTVSDKKRKTVNYVKLCTELSYINNVGTSLNKLNKHKNT